MLFSDSCKVIKNVLRKRDGQFPLLNIDGK